MRILLIGTSNATSDFAQYFAQNSENIVFTTKEGTEANFIDINPQNTEELKEFALANEINLTILCDEKAILSEISNVFSSNGLSVFAPEGESLKLINSKIWAKKFIYKNKIPTPRFQFFEKPQAAIDAIRQGHFPIVVKSDEYQKDGVRICETFKKAKLATEELFSCGSKKILIEDYIWGKEFSVYAISDGYNPIFLSEVSTYQNTFAKLDVDFLDDKQKEEILNTIIKPFLGALAKENGEYIGILGFNFVQTKDKTYLISCDAFIKDLCSNMVINSIKDSWAELFDDALSGVLTQEFKEIKHKDLHAFSAQIYKNGEKINFCEFGRTYNEAKSKLLEQEIEQKDLEEAIKVWKY